MVMHVGYILRVPSRVWESRSVMTRLAYGFGVVASNGLTVLVCLGIQLLHISRFREIRRIYRIGVFNLLVFITQKDVTRAEGGGIAL